MTSALIGHTGFVGGNLARQMHFDEFYNSKNIEDIRGRELNVVVCAGAPGAKWYANDHPCDDLKSVVRLRKALRGADIRTLVIISTIDAIDPVDPYGFHRSSLETCRKDAIVVRLSALFGPGLKKNALYDLMTEQRETEISPNAIYQWYPLRRLGDDLRRIQELGITTINLVSDPITMDEIRSRFFPRHVIGAPREDAPNYNVPCGYPEFWLSKAEIMDEMGMFLAGVR